MTGKTPTIMLDTNVWIDCYLANRKAHKDALALINAASRLEYTLAYASVSIKDVFYLVNQSCKYMVRQAKADLSDYDAVACQKIAWGCVRNMAELAIAVPVGEGQVWLASHYEDLHPDFEDDLIVAAIETSKADYFVTEDETLRRKVPCAAYNIADMLCYLRIQEEVASL